MDSAGFVGVRRGFARGWGFLKAAKGWRLGALGVATSFLTVQLLLVTLSGVRTMQDSVLEHGSVHLDVLPGTLDQRVQELYAELQQLPSVRSVTYVPREQVFADERARDESLGKFLEQYDLANPFSDTFVVVPATSAAYADLRAFVEASETGIDAVALSDIAVREASTGQLLGAADTARMGVNVLMLLSVFSAALLSLNLLVHLASLRRQAAAAEMLLGAPVGVMAAPTVAAGMIVLLGSLLLATLLTIGAVVLLSLFPSSAAIGSWLLRNVLVAWSATLPLTLLLEAAAAAMLAWLVGRAGSSFRS